MEKAIQGLREILREFFLPRPYSLYRGIEVNRCKADGQLVTKNMDLERHAGHQIVSPVVLSLKEKLLIWLTIVQ